MTKEVGVKPEIEVFDPGMIYNAQYYIKKGILDTPAHFQFCMGCAGGISATTKNLVFMKGVMDEVAPDSTWSAFGVGAGAMEILYAAIAMGGQYPRGYGRQCSLQEGRPCRKQYGICCPRQTHY